MTEKITTQHPGGKKGASVEKAKYDPVCTAILQTLKETPLITHSELDKIVSKKLISFPGAVSWYVECVKLDLEAKKVIERTYTVPEKYRLVQR